MGHSYINFLCFSVILLLHEASGLATMAFDIGTEYTKIAIVKPGVPMEIALDSESQRKTPVVLSFRNDERLIGNPAVSNSIKYPESAFREIPGLIGRSLSHPVVEEFRRRYPFHQLLYDKESGQLVFHLKDSQYTVEELYAMLLEDYREIAENFAGVPIKTAVITVPYHFSQAERRAVLRAAQLAGIDVLQLMNSNTAVGLNYGLFRRKSFNETGQYYIFYDMGSLSTTATVVLYQTVKQTDSDGPGEHPQMTIVGVGSAPLLGTSSFIQRLVEHLVNLFNTNRIKSTGDIRQNARSMAKLRVEASRVLKVLSANTETFAQVESLYEEEDFKRKVTRSDLEKICADLFDQISSPIFTALEMAQVPLPVIKEVILMGGGSRIPKIQEILLKVTEKSELGKGINTDEAAALGAVYQAAFHSPGFRVMKFIVKDANPYAIAIDFERVSTDVNGNNYVRRILFSQNNPYPQKRAITFNKQNKDTIFYVNYADVKFPMSQFIGEHHNITSVETKGVTSIVERHLSSGRVNVRGVKAHFSLDYSGILTLTGIDVIFNPRDPSEIDPPAKQQAGEKSTLQKLGSTISGLFGGSSDSETQPTASNSASEPPFADAQSANHFENHTDGINSTKEAVEASRTSAKQTLEPTSQEPIIEMVSFDVNQLDSPLPNSDMSASFEKLKKVRLEVLARRELERSKNELESFIFDTRDRLESEEFIKYSTESERETIRNAVNQVSDWYEEHGFDLQAQAYIDERNRLVESLKPITVRIRESLDRPKAFANLHKVINLTDTLLDSFPQFIEISRNLTSKNNLVRRSLAELEANSTKASTESTTQPTTDAAATSEENVTTATDYDNQKPSTKIDTPLEDIFDIYVKAEDRKRILAILTDTKSWQQEAEKVQTQANLAGPPEVTSVDVNTKANKLKNEYSYLLGRLNLWRNEFTTMSRNLLNLEAKLAQHHSKLNKPFQGSADQTISPDDIQQKSQQPDADQKTTDEELAAPKSVDSTSATSEPTTTPRSDL